MFEAFLRFGHYTPLVGAPTLSLPIGQQPKAVPVGGIDLVGAPGDDRRLLAIGARRDEGRVRESPSGQSIFGSRDPTG